MVRACIAVLAGRAPAGYSPPICVFRKLAATGMMSVLCLLLLLQQPVQPDQGDRPRWTLPRGERVVAWVDPADPLASTVRSLAAEEGVDVMPEWTDPPPGTAFVFWVASSDRLTDSAFVRAGLHLLREPSYPAIGILTGTPATVQRIWKAAAPRDPGAVVAVNGKNPAAGAYSERIVRLLPEGQRTEHLAKELVIKALAQSRYLTYAGHGGPGYWGLEPGGALRANDVPVLADAVIGTTACRTLHFAGGDAIALRMLEQGADAYAGFVFSPIEGYVAGEFDGFPFLHTWPGFTIGHVARLHARVPGQGAVSARLGPCGRHAPRAAL